MQHWDFLKSTGDMGPPPIKGPTLPPWAPPLANILPTQEDKGTYISPLTSAPILRSFSLVWENLHINIDTFVIRCMCFPLCFLYAKPHLKITLFLDAWPSELLTLIANWVNFSLYFSFAPNFFSLLFVRICNFLKKIKK